MQKVCEALSVHLGVCPQDGDYTVTVSATDCETFQKLDEEKWLLVYKMGAPVGIQRTSDWFAVSSDDGRLLFFRTLDTPGIQERIEIRPTEPITGDVRRNTTPFYFDDWTLKQMFKFG